MVEGKIRVNTLVKFLNLCFFTFRNNRLPTLDEIMEKNGCCRGHAYNYLRALKHLYPEELLERVRQERQDRYVQQILE